MTAPAQRLRDAARGSELVTAVLAGHVRGDWSDHTYNCLGCVRRFEDASKERFEAVGRQPTREEMLEFRAGYSKLSHPGWTLTDYNTHVADAIVDSLAVADAFLGVEHE